MKAYWHLGILNCQFYSDIVIKSGSNNDYIIRSRDPSITVFGGTYSEQTLKVQRKYETSTHRAYSQLSFKHSTAIGESSFHLYLNVGNNDWEATLSNKSAK